MGTGNSYYIPSNNVAFCDFVETGAGYAAANHERWGVEAPPENLIDNLTRLKTLAHLCTTSKRTPEDMVERNTLRKELEREVRKYLQGFVMRNPHVTDKDRTAMGLPLRDAKPTPVGNPVGLVTAMVKYTQEGSLELYIEHVDTTPFDKRANYGVKIVYNVFPADVPLPEDVEMLIHNKFVRRKKLLFPFGKSNSGKRAVFCLRYENSKGESGEWGPTVSAIIP